MTHDRCPKVNVPEAETELASRKELFVWEPGNAKVIHTTQKLVRDTKPVREVKVKVKLAEG